MATWLANLRLSDLADLLYRRRDHVAEYRLIGFHDLAELLQDPWVLYGVIPSLPLPAFQVIEAHAALGRFVTVDALSGLLAASGTPEQHRANVVGVLELLSSEGLAWSDDGAHWGLATGFEEMIRSPLGLGPSGEVLLARMNVESMKATLRALDLPRTGDRSRLEATLRGFYLDADAIRARVAAAPPAIRGALETEAAGESVPPRRSTPGGRRLGPEAERWAVERALLFPDLDYRMVMPSQVRLALRGSVRAPFDPTRPEVTPTPTPMEQITGEAGAAALAFLATTTMVMASLARQPVPTLKDGAVGLRETRKLAKAVGATEATVTLVLALADPVGLLSESASRVGASDHFRIWSRSDPESRLAQLVMAWWRLPVIPTLTAKDAKSTGAGIMNAVHLRDESDLRHAAVRAFVECGEGTSVADTASLAARITWRHPVLVGGRSAAIPTIVAEAQQLGVLGGTGAGPLAFAVSSADNSNLTPAALATLPAMTATATFGSDLTVLVSGSPAARVTTLLDGCADRESGGSASIWRFSPTSIRRALDDGSSAADLLSALAEIAADPLPQPLEYLITDIGRRYGMVTVTAGLCVLHGDRDPALLAQICSDRSLRQLGLHLIAPTVAISQQDSDTTLTALRAAGYLPSQDRGPAAGATPGAQPSRSDLFRQESELDRLAEKVDVELLRLLKPALGSPTTRQRSEKAARQRAQAMAEALHSPRPPGR